FYRTFNTGDSSRRRRGSAPCTGLYQPTTRERPMRLCLASLHPRILSGQIEGLTGLGRALVRRGHDVDLVAPFDTTGLLDDDLVERDQGPTHLASAARRMVATVPRIVRQGRGHDLIHLALPTPAFAWVADLVRAASGTRVVVGFEGHLAHVEQL